MKSERMMDANVSVRDAERLTSFVAADFFGIRRANFKGFTIDRLTTILDRLNRIGGGISGCRKNDFGRFEPFEAPIGKPLAPVAKCDVAHTFYDVVQLRAALVVTPTPSIRAIIL